MFTQNNKLLQIIMFANQYHQQGDKDKQELTIILLIILKTETFSEEAPKIKQFKNKLMEWAIRYK